MSPKAAKEGDSAPESLAVTLAGTAFVLPVIIGYSFHAYRILGGKAGDLSYDQDSSPGPDRISGRGHHYYE